MEDDSRPCVGLCPPRTTKLVTNLPPAPPASQPILISHNAPPHCRGIRFVSEPHAHAPSSGLPPNLGPPIPALISRSHARGQPLAALAPTVTTKAIHITTRELKRPLFRHLFLFMASAVLLSRVTPAAMPVSPLPASPAFALAPPLPLHRAGPRARTRPPPTQPPSPPPPNRQPSAAQQFQGRPRRPRGPSRRRE